MRNISNTVLMLKTILHKTALLSQIPKKTICATLINIFTYTLRPNVYKVIKTYLLDLLKNPSSVPHVRIPLESTKLLRH